MYSGATVEFDTRSSMGILKEIGKGTSRLRRSDRWYRGERAEKRKEYFQELKRVRKRQWENAWEDFKSQKVINLREIAKQEAIARAKVPKVRLQRRQMLKGQKGYIPTAKRRPLVRQAIRRREKLFKPFNTARAEVSKFGRNLMKQKPK